MRIELYRRWFTAASTIGEVFVDSHPLRECVTLEPALDHQLHPAIPEGTYNIELLPSAHFGTLTPWLMNVPGRSEIEIHPGNFPYQTKGCILVGADCGANYVNRSKETFDRLMVLLKTAEPGTVSITIQNAPQAQPPAAS